MIPRRKFPKIRFVNLYLTSGWMLWNGWRVFKHHITPIIDRYWKGELVYIGFPYLYFSLDYRGGNFIEEIRDHEWNRNLPKN